MGERYFGRWLLWELFWREETRKGMLNMTWKNSKSGTSEESPKLPQNVRNFRRMSGTFEEMSGTSEVSRKIQQILRFEHILILEILEIDLG